MTAPRSCAASALPPPSPSSRSESRWRRAGGALLAAALVVPFSLGLLAGLAPVAEAHTRGDGTPHNDGGAGHEPVITIETSTPVVTEGQGIVLTIKANRAFPEAHFGLDQGLSPTDLREGTYRAAGVLARSHGPVERFGIRRYTGNPWGGGGNFVPVFSAGETEKTVIMRTSVDRGSYAGRVGFSIRASDFGSYHVGSPSIVWVTIRNNDDPTVNRPNYRPPRRVQQLTVQAPSSTSVTVTWTAPVDSGGWPITDYDVRYRTAGSGWTELDDTTPSTATTAQITGLTSGQTVHVQVRAENTGLVGTWKQAAAITPGTGNRQVLPAPEIVGAPDIAGPPGDDGRWGPGETVEATLTFDATVTVSGAPTLGVDLGAATRRAAYVRGSGTSALTFAYRLVAADGVASSVSVPPDSLALNGGAIRSADGADADLSHHGAGLLGAPDVPLGPPLTAQFHDVPGGHDGESAFAFELRFSEDVAGLSFRTLRDDGLRAENGRVTKAKRMEQGKNRRWRITVEPSSSGDVTVTLPATIVCGAGAAICAPDGRKLSNAATATIRGPAQSPPPTLSVADAQAPEGGTLEFTVSLSPAASSTVTVDYATADGTAAAGEDYTAASGTLTFAPGETVKTVEVAALADDATEGGETFTLALSGPAGATLSGGAGTGTVEDVARARTVPALTARFLDVPPEHDGARFTFELRFSEEPEGLSFRTVRDSVLAVAGGTVRRAKRVVGGSNLAFRIHIHPTGLGDVTVTLRPTPACGEAGSVCTADGRRLAGSLAANIAGPATFSVADAGAREGQGAALEFRVTLNRARHEATRVDYATSGGTAVSGTDFTAAAGTLVFAAGETAKTVSVPVLDDAHDDDGETLTLTLSNPAPASYVRLADATATGSISNADPLQRDWLARFGRTAAADAVAAVTARLETPRDAGSHFTVGGHRLPLDGSGSAGAVPGLPAAASGPGGASWPAWPGEPSGDGERTMSGRELLLGTSFRAVLGGGAGPRWTGWGQGASVSRFSGAAPGLSLSGETATGSLGMDYEQGRLLTGFAMTHSLGEGTARGAGRSYIMGSTVTKMLPYARLRLSERVSAWGLAGTGTGQMTLDLDGGAAAQRYRTDLSMTLAAMGVRGDLVTPTQAGGFALALKADGFWVRTESDGVSAPGVGNLSGAHAEASRLRAVLDGSRSFAFASGATLTPSVELGVRHDAGDAETGTGLELGAGLGYADPSRDLDMALRVHGLAAHAGDGYSEWSVSGSLRLVPGAAGRGLSMSLTPSYGADRGGSERLWTLPDAHALAADGDAPLSGRLDAEVGYGMALFGGGFTGTPHVGLGLSDTARELRMGWRLSPAGAGAGGFSFRIDAARRDSAGDAPEHRIGVGMASRW